MRPALPQRLATVIATFTMAIALVGCSQTSNPTYDLGKSGCSGVDEATLGTIQDEVHADGLLRNGKQVTHGDQRFVSAELHLVGDGDHHKGDILTWVTSGADEAAFHSVDVHARDNSSWPVADVDVRAEGARESRACVLPDLGKTDAQIKCEQDEATNNGPPLPGGRTCGDL
jgi:hypothetical protein